MCGGRGSRLGGDTEKPLVAVAGVPMVDRVLDALDDAERVGDVSCAVSPHTPATRDHLRERDGVVVVDTPGDGYVADLSHALDRVGSPVVTVASDLPLLTGGVVDRVLDRVVGAGVGVDTTTTVDGRAVAPTGLHVVVDGAADEAVVLGDERLAVNVNRPRDLRVADALVEDR